MQRSFKCVQGQVQAKGPGQLGLGHDAEFCQYHEGSQEVDWVQNHEHEFKAKIIKDIKSD